MKINRAYRYELRPNIEQRILLAKHAGCARFAYNWGLDQRIKQYEKDKTSTNAIAQHRALNSLKQTEFHWMYEVSKCAPQEALRDLDTAFKNFFRALKQGENTGFPQFKKKDDRASFRLTGTIHIQERGVQLPRLGFIRTKETPAVQGRILSVTCSREADRWFVSVCVEEEIEEPKQIQGEPIAIDLGLTTFATLSTEEKIQAPKPLKKHERKLKRLQKQHSRKVKGSQNSKKSKLKIARKHRRIRNIRKDFLHQFSTKLAKATPVVVMEDLNTKGMMQNRKLSKSIADVGWGELYTLLEYKTKWYGSKLVLAPRYFASSKTCHICGYKHDEMSLSIREWSCPECATEQDRDINAAKCLLRWYSTESSSGIYACGDTSNGTAELAVSYVSKKQELMSGIFVHKL